MNDDPTESNTTSSEDSTVEESMWHILLQKGIFLVRPLGGFFLDFQLGLLELGFFLLVMHFLLQSHLLAPLDNSAWL